GKCGSVEKVQIAFKSIDDRDTVTYNTMSEYIYFYSRFI
ncbi:unnamed protein product, partial [Rotaria magnacalcarata]